ncbi:CsbD family protein [Maritalea sp.]|uniref:CsbD family protein n=1 Tax=Maritalea sp. TaxID=2003361 RepID=UPI003EF521B7
MNRNEIEGKWEQVKGKAKAQWGELTDDDLAVIDGNRQQLVGKLQERYGKAQEDVEAEVDEWLVNSRLEER